MAEGNLGQFAITNQKLDKILQQCRELEDLMRSFVAKRLVAPAPAPRTDQNQSIAFLESKGSSEDNFKGVAHKMFDVMPSNDVVPLPSETPEIRSMVVNKEWDRNTLGKSPEETGDSSSIDKRHGIDNWSTTMTYSSNTGMNRISKLSFPIIECNKSRNWVKDCSVVCGIKKNQKLESAVIGDDKEAEVYLQRNLIQDLVFVCGSFDAYQVFDKMPLRDSNIGNSRIPQMHMFRGKWVMEQHVFDPGITMRCREKQVFDPDREFVSFANWTQAFQNFVDRRELVQLFVENFGVFAELMCDFDFEDSVASIDSFVFDPGGSNSLNLVALDDIVGIFEHSRVCANSSHAAVLVHICWLFGGLILVWDPGGITTLLDKLGNQSM